jgi:hypothetical protein
MLSNDATSGIYLKEYKPGQNRAIGTSMFTASLFIITRFWKESPTTDGWIK